MPAAERLPFLRSATLPLSDPGRSDIDINYFLAREQIELALARASADPGARTAHQQMADRYRDLVQDHRRAAGAGGIFSFRVNAAQAAG